MFKKILALVVLASVSTVAFAQGTVSFNTVIASIGTDAKVSDPNGVAVIGLAYMAQLYAGPGTTAESALVAVGNPVGFKAGFNAGYVQTTGTAFGSAVDSVVTLPAATPGGPVTIQLRAWDSAYSTYEAALTASAASGKSALLALGITGNPILPGTPPVDLSGLTGFTMTGGAIIPEPSSIALMLLGGAALLIRRRK